MVVYKTWFFSECKIMRDMKGGAKDAPSKGYAFVTFTEHQSALNALRKLNNNPEVSDIDRNFSNVPGRKRKRTRMFSFVQDKACDEQTRPSVVL